MSCTGLWVVWFKRGMYRPGASIFSKGKAGLSAQQRGSGAQCFEPGEGMKQASSRTGLWPGTPDGGVLGGFVWLKLGLTHIALPWELKSGHRGLGAGRE